MSAETVIPVPAEWAARAKVDAARYADMYRQSLSDPDAFWRVHRNAIVRVAAIRQVKPDEDGHMQAWLDGAPEPIRVGESFRYRSGRCERA